jgi:hypothetical protein
LGNQSELASICPDGDLIAIDGRGRSCIVRQSLLRLLCPHDIGQIGAVGAHIADVHVGDAADALLAPRHILEHGEAWRPDRTVASWYLFRAVDLHKAGRVKLKDLGVQKTGYPKDGPILA